MIVYYKYSGDRPDVDVNRPVELSLESVLRVFRDLNPKRGFVSIILSQRQSLQIVAMTCGRMWIELLDKAERAYDFAVGNHAVAEELIRAAASGEDVFQLARMKLGEWNHGDLS
jgi:hypothetical protein